LDDEELQAPRTRRPTKRAERPQRSRRIGRW
jgi:hypothetical protein